MTSTPLPDQLPGTADRGGEADRRGRASPRAAGREPGGHKIIVSVVMAIIGMAFLLPLVWLILAAFNPHATSGLSAPAVSVANFRAAFRAGAGSAIADSLYLAGGSAIIAAVVSTLSGYVLSRRYVPL